MNFTKKSILLYCCCFIFIISCNNKEKEQVVVKESIETYIKNEFFKKNYDFNVLELKIDTIYTMSVESIIAMGVKASVIRNSNTIRNEGVDVLTPQYETRLDYLCENDKKIIKLKSLRKNYNSEQIGKYVVVFLKGKYKDNHGIENNYWRENLDFMIDDKNMVIDSGLRLN